MDINIGEEKERLMNMNEAERTDDFVHNVSEAVRRAAKHLAMNKAMVKSFGVTPEEFDKAFEREYKAAWDNVKDKSSHELAIIGLLEMAHAGVDIEEILR